MKTIFAIEDQFGLNVYPKRPLNIVKGDGAVLWDDKGNQYIDCVSGNGVANVGHCNPYVVKAIQEQAPQLITVPGTFYNNKRAEFFEKLNYITPNYLKKIFLCNSGAESIEAAIKLSRIVTKKSEIICAMRSYHGRTMGALSATFKKDYKVDFEPLVPGFQFAPLNKIEKFEAKINDNTAAILLEVVQGEGGVNIGDKNFFLEISKLCREKNILLIIDEVQTGFCRTGSFFAFEQMEIEPDIVCMAKAIAGGIPMGAMVCRDNMEFSIGKHGNTFGGNPIACAAGCAAIEFMIENNLHQQAAEKGHYFFSKFSDSLPEIVREVRFKGLMIGIELKTKVKPFIFDLMKEGILVLPAGSTVLRLLPPLVIKYEQIDLVIEKLNQSLNTKDIN